MGGAVFHQGATTMAKLNWKQQHPKDMKTAIRHLNVLVGLGLVTPEECDELIYVRLEQNGEKPEDVMRPLLRQLCRRFAN
jgi:hypothetical protein